MATIILKKAISRRAVLKGMGVTLALPFLDSMVPALSAAPASPTRFGAIYLPHGLLRTHWEPSTVGADFEITPIMKPLEPFRSQLMVLSGFTAGPTVQNGGHAVAPASYLSGNIQPKQTEGADIYAAVTIDQVLAKAIGQQTPFPSLEVATEDFSTSIGACDTGYSCIYMNTISWASPTSPLPMEINPRVIFERMFGGAGTPEQRLARMQENRSILDGVTETIARFHGGLGQRDRTRLADYLSDVREIERRIQNAEEQAQAHPITLESPVGTPQAYEDHVALLFDLLAAAYQADVTRIFTFMMMRDVTGRSFPQIGVSDPHHALSHEANGRSNDPSKPVKFATVNAYHTSLFAKFLAKLKSTPDGDGTLLDHSMILYGSAMSNANDHTHHPLPLALVGGGNGQLKKLGQHVSMPDETMANLLLTVAQRAGASLTSFGRSTKALDI
jgi:hypothetical protein